MIKNLKLKPLEKEQIITSLDRLTRFKPTSEKYLRVFYGLISSNLISPKLKKEEIKKMEYDEIVDIVNQIFKKSAESLNIRETKNYSINEKLLKYEDSIFQLDNETKKLLKNEIDYKAFSELLDKELPCNLKWLKYIEDDNVREKYSTKFPIEKVVLVEGITEEILLPKFAKIFGYDFDKNGILIIPAGGKNQSVKMFYSLYEILKIPIFVLFDKDAEENSAEIKYKLRKWDKIHILSCGEFEDCLSLNHIKRTLNNTFKNYYKFSLNQLRTDKPMTKTLDMIFKECNSEFKKSEFANALSKGIKKEDITIYIKDLLNDIRNG